MILLIALLTKDNSRLLKRNEGNGHKHFAISFLSKYLGLSDFNWLSFRSELPIYEPVFPSALSLSTLSKECFCTWIVREQMQKGKCHYLCFTFVCFYEVSWNKANRWLYFMAWSKPETFACMLGSWGKSVLWTSVESILGCFHSLTWHIFSVAGKPRSIRSLCEISQKLWSGDL